MRSPRSKPSGLWIVYHYHVLSPQQRSTLQELTNQGILLLPRITDELTNDGLFNYRRLYGSATLGELTSPHSPRISLVTVPH